MTTASFRASVELTNVCKMHILQIPKPNKRILTFLITFALEWVSDGDDDEQE